MQPIVIVHGGAGHVPDERIPFKIAGCKLSAKTGYKVLQETGNALDAIEAAIHVMEDDEHFNAGFGSVLNLDGEVEMDASIMVGEDLRAGAVSIVKDVKYPISLARKIMENTPHVLLAGPAAKKFAEEQGLEIAKPGALVSEAARRALANHKNQGVGLTEIGQKGTKTEVDTVGCVVIDANGKLFAGTSTGGLSGKMTGRVSDTSMIGSGTYADDLHGAVSTTGHGETIAKYVLAHSIVREIASGKSAQQATDDAISDMTKRLKNTAGAITISSNGDVGVGFSSPRMGWAYQKGNEIHFGIEKGEDQVEKL